MCSNTKLTSISSRSGLAADKLLCRLGPFWMSSRQSKAPSPVAARCQWLHFPRFWHYGRRVDLTHALSAMSHNVEGFRIALHRSSVWAGSSSGRVLGTLAKSSKKAVCCSLPFLVL